MADLTADILVDGSLSAEREALIHQALATLGTSGQIRVLPLRRGTSDLQWLIMVTLPLQAFLGSVGGKFGEDAYRGFQNIIRKLLRPEHAARWPQAGPWCSRTPRAGCGSSSIPICRPRATSNC
jgi:hypothetical protein